jgi:hypothetical protein
METQSRERTLFLHSQDKNELEALGKSLTLPQFLDLLDAGSQIKEGLRRHLDPLLVGLPNQLFYLSLRALSPPQLQVLCRVADDEPLQYHLTLLIHYLADQAEQRANSLELLARDITVYDVGKATHQDIDGFRKRMQEVVEFFREALEIVDRALALAWNTNREELIDKLTILKESWIRYMNTELGKPGDTRNAATGIYLLFDDHFGAVYGGSGVHPLSALADADAAFDALGALSVWYVEDYWDVGLLPGIETAEQLHRQDHDEVSRRLYRERLTTTARENLAALGLNTVGDLKHKRLYSRRMLSRYIHAYRQRLSVFSPP